MSSRPGPFDTVDVRPPGARRPERRRPPLVGWRPRVPVLAGRANGRQIKRAPAKQSRHTHRPPRPAPVGNICIRRAGGRQPVAQVAPPVASHPLHSPLHWPPTSCVSLSDACRWRARPAQPPAPLAWAHLGRKWAHLSSSMWRGRPFLRMRPLARPRPGAQFSLVAPAPLNHYFWLLFAGLSTSQ